MVRCLTSLAFRRSRFFRATASALRRSSYSSAVSGGIPSWELATHLILNLLFLVHLLGNLDSFSELLCGFGFHIQPELRVESKEHRCH